MHFYRRDRGQPHRRERTKMGEDKWGTRNCRGRALRRSWSVGYQGRHKARPLRLPSLRFVGVNGASPVPTNENGSFEGKLV